MHSQHLSEAIPPIDGPPGVTARGIATTLMVVLLLGWIVLAALALLRGPALGDHEVIVAQIARQSLASQSWLVPRYLDTPFLMKPPLAPWLVGASAALFPDGSAPAAVNDFSARLPSVIATVLSGLIVWRLAVSMFGPGMAWISFFVYMTSVGAMLYAFNATAEAVLTLFCTWAFAEFWWSRRCRGRRRTLHQVMFYCALGMAMLAKGPMPLAVVCAPLAVYWWLDRPTRRLIVRGGRGVAAVAKTTMIESGRRLKLALTDLGLWWGIPLFLLMFIPWFILVARKEPYLWKLWDYEYLDRLQGDYPGVRRGKYFYYLPIMFGFAIPWALSLPEALIAPFRRVYRKFMRPLVFAWFWAIVTLLVGSMMSFKKPYYILPALPALALLLTPVVHRFFFVRGREETAARATVSHSRRRLIALSLVFGVGIGVVVASWFAARKVYPEEWHGLVTWAAPLVLLSATLGFAGAALWYIRGRRLGSLLAVGSTGATCFIVGWCLLGPSLGNVDIPMELVRKLEAAGVPRDADLYWASNRPDGRVVFYGGRNLVQMLDPYRLIAEQGDSQSGDDLRELVADKIVEKLRGGTNVYFVFQRGDFEKLMSWFGPPARELLHVDRGEPGLDKDDWVVATNAGVAAGGRPG